MILVYSANMLVNLLPALNGSAFIRDDLSFRRLCINKSTSVQNISDPNTTNKVNYTNPYIKTTEKEKPDEAGKTVSFCSSKDFHNLYGLVKKTEPDINSVSGFFYAETILYNDFPINSPPPQLA